MCNRMVMFWFFKQTPAFLLSIPGFWQIIPQYSTGRANIFGIFESNATAIGAADAVSFLHNAKQKFSCKKYVTASLGITHCVRLVIADCTTAAAAAMMMIII